MAEKRIKYDFNSVGLSTEEVNEEATGTASRIPLSIATPIRFSNDPQSSFRMHHNSIDMILDNLRNLLATNYGSRLISCGMGANLDELVYEIGTEDGDVKVMNRISSAVGTYMPFINLAGYEPMRKLDTSGNVSKVAMTITFTIPSISENLISLDVNLFEAL